VKCVVGDEDSTIGVLIHYYTLESSIVLTSGGNELKNKQFDQCALKRTSIRMIYSESKINIITVQHKYMKQLRLENNIR
jgi:hypothetical protein